MITAAAEVDAMAELALLLAADRCRMLPTLMMSHSPLLLVWLAPDNTVVAPPPTAPPLMPAASPPPSDTGPESARSVALWLPSPHPAAVGSSAAPEVDTAAMCR